MNIDYRTGDLFSADAEALVNTVNCVGVMGKGIALQFKKRFPDNFKDYSEACKRKEVQPGHMFVFETRRPDGNPKYIINFPTKRHWRARSRLDDVKAGLADLADQIRRWKIRSIAMPALGCGHGGLEWEEVRSQIEKEFGDLSADVQISVFTPEEASDTTSMTRSIEALDMTPGRAALVILMERYLSGQPKEPRVLPEATVHELAYFLQVAGEPLQLDYSDGNGSPRAEKFHRVLRRMEGHWISGRPGNGKESGRLFELMPETVRDAKGFLGNRPETRGHVDRVGDLMDGFETPLGIKLLASVHWTVCHGRSASVDDVNRRLRGREFYRRQIEQAYQTIEKLGWLHDEEGTKRVIGEDPGFPAKARVSDELLPEQRDDCPTSDGSAIHINVNTATIGDLEKLPGIGNKRAQAIVAHRDRHGPFRNDKDLAEVRGIGKGVCHKIVHSITLGEHGRRLI